MIGVIKSELPDKAILLKYRDSYTDCYSLFVAQNLTLEPYVQAFYTGRVFKLERWLISTFTGLPSSQNQLDDMLYNNSEIFSAWTVEERTEGQLLMCDFQKRTRSWFMVVPENNGTRFYFGSAVVKTDYWNSASERFAQLIFKILMPFHWLYSRILLGGAARNLRRTEFK